MEVEGVLRVVLALGDLPGPFSDPETPYGEAQAARADAGGIRGR